ncbi:putative glycoside hydrolase [Wenyingzhuangia fucanilytica]|uniref:putative glycoside hydrolase n=1 Tax=Wenyingzhuangia fucanilytica TaxID=1790137 RepID=UPI0009F4B5CA|nr:putative glycoside hydrolase [Wenyingzhuangia fucanilytica]
MKFYSILINRFLLIFSFVFILFSCSKNQEIKENSDVLDTEVFSELSISDGTVFQPKDFFPKFSWEVTPQYCMFGDGSRTLTTSEVEVVSGKSNFVCIEKNHAWTVLEYAEVGTKHEVEAFKKLQPEIKVLYYFNSAYAWPFTSYNENFTRSRIDNYPELKKFLIVNETTGELEHRNNIFFFDVLNPDFREWWVNTVVAGVNFSGADGVFIDQMHGFVWLRNSQKNEVEKAMGEMMLNLKKALGDDKILLGNNASDVVEVFPAIDAAMFEHYNTQKLSKENLLKEWGDMLNNAKAGKISIFRIGVEAEDDPSIDGLTGAAKENALEKLSKERLEYYQACYLIGAQPYSYFQYGWGWRLDTGPLVDYPELQKSLGIPKGAYKRVHENAWEFTREFEHAKVWVDTENKEAKITWL